MRRPLAARARWTVRLAVGLSSALLWASCADETPVRDTRRSPATQGEPHVDHDDPEPWPWADAGAAPVQGASDAGAPAADKAPPAQGSDAGVDTMDADLPIDAAPDATPMDATISLDAQSVDAAGTAEDAGADASDDGPTPSALHAALLAKLRACGVVGEGLHYERPIEDGFDRCVALCQIIAECPALRATRCKSQVDANLQGCQSRCTNLPLDDGFVCGDESRLRRSWVCDQAPDCADGADEANCEPYTCASGDIIPSPHVRCDGVKDCADESDELGCAPRCPADP